MSDDVPSERTNHFILGLDCGTSSMNISYATYTDEGEKSIDWNDVNHVKGWGIYDPLNARDGSIELPTELLPTPEKTYYGYDVQAQLDHPLNTHFSKYHVKYVKPFDTSRQSEGEWQGAGREVFDFLKQEGLIAEDDDVRSKFLTLTLQDVKKFLEQRPDSLRWTPQSKVKFAITIPNTWSEDTKRHYKRSLAVAVRGSGLGKTRNRTLGHAIEVDGHTEYVVNDCDDLNDVYILTEPEAAARYFFAARLGGGRIWRGSTVLVMDIGGGTSDFTTYVVTEETPLRLGRQVCEHKGGNWGANMLNDNIRRLSLRRLEGETYLEDGGQTTIAQIVEKNIVRVFEAEAKRRIDFDLFSEFLFTVPYLQENKEKGFPKWGCFLVSAKEMLEEVFQPWFNGNGELLREQISNIKAVKGATPLILPIGGGVEQPAILPYLQKHVLDEFNKKDGTDLCFVEAPYKGFSGTLVADGAVYAAANPNDAPERISTVSQGIIRHYPLDKQAYPHCYDILKTQKITNNFEYDGPFVEDVIVYFQQKGVRYPPNKTFDPIPGVFTFYRHNKPDARIREALVWKDTPAESFYQVTHEKNEGHQIVQVLSRDFKPLENMIKGTYKYELVEDEDGKRKKKRVLRYDVPYTIHPELHGTDMILTMKWTPPGGDIQELARCQADLSAAVEIEDINKSTQPPTSQLSQELRAVTLPRKPGEPESQEWTARPEGTQNSTRPLQELMSGETSRPTTIHPELPVEDHGEETQPEETLLDNETASASRSVQSIEPTFNHPRKRDRLGSLTGKQRQQPLRSRPRLLQEATPAETLTSGKNCSTHRFSRFTPVNQRSARPSDSPTLRHFFQSSRSQQTLDRPRKRQQTEVSNLSKEMAQVDLPPPRPQASQHRHAESRSRREYDSRSSSSEATGFGEFGVGFIAQSTPVRTSAYSNRVLRKANTLRTDVNLLRSESYEFSIDRVSGSRH